MQPPSRTLHDIFLDDIHEKFPKFVPRHDFDILALADGHFKGDEKTLRAWLDQEFAFQVMMCGDARVPIDSARDMLSAPGIVTGAKPRPGDAGVFVRQIPRSKYSIRLFPGSPALKEYCLDFVETRTGRPTNSPFEFSLWTTGHRARPHVCGPVWLRSLEEAFGYLTKDILPGEEKFVLTDGMTCMLTRPGHKALRFTVPTRGHTLDSYDGDELDLPEYID